MFLGVPECTVVAVDHRLTMAAVFDLMTWVDSATPTATWTATNRDDVPSTVASARDDPDHQHPLTVAATVTTEETGYFDDCASAIDFRQMANRCWTGNGSYFDMLPSSVAAVVVGSHNFWTLLLLVFPVLTVFGNVLVVLGVYRVVYRDVLGFGTV